MNSGTTPTTSWLSLPQMLRLPETPLIEALWQILCQIRCCAPGIIQSFDEDAGTVTVQLAVRESMNVATQSGQGFSAPVPTPTEIPVLSDVPVVLYGGGGYVITCPITAGDECLVVFGDNCYNAWWTNGGIQNQEIKRRHDLSDGFAIVGIRSQPNKLSNWSTEALQIRSKDGSTVVEVGDNEVTVTVGSISLVVNETQVTVNGNLVVNGNITTPSGTVQSGSIVLATHEHGNVTSGPDITGPPLP